MHPPRLGIILLAALWIVLAGVSPATAQQRQRRVFTNEDLPSAAPPAPQAPAAAPAAAPSEAAPGEAAAGEAAAPSGFEAPAPSDENLPPGLALSNFLQGALRRFHTEFAERLDEETDPTRQERLKLMMQLTMQLLAQNQLYIADIKAQQEQAEGGAAAQAGAPPAP